MRLLLLCIAAALAFIIGANVQQADALSSDPKHFISADNTFYAYVKAGEKIAASFTKASYEDTPGMKRVDVTITMDGPDMKQQKCVIPANASVGKSCRFSQKAATKSGIWRINFSLPSTASLFKDAPLDIRWGRNFFTWDIDITDKNGEQSGRIWTERYAFRQPAGDADNDFTSTFTTHYVSEDGYIYKAINHEYNGQVSVLSADSIGMRKGTECVSAYQSAEVNNEDLSPSHGTCGNKYKLFFEEPAGNLPEKADRWDGETDWVRPGIKRPSISELHFNPDGSNDQLSGTISFFLRNFIGQYEIKIDVDNDGGFDGQNDVVLRQQMKNLSNSLQRVHFQGVDKTGQIIFPSQTIGIRVEITRVAEIHFVAADVEGRAGIELIRLNGDSAPTSGICWNDTGLDPVADPSFMTPVVDGRNCPDSTGGVHGWKYGTGTAPWGNARYIDDWVYATAKLDGNNQIIYPEEESTEATAVRQNWIVPAIIAGVVVIIGLGTAVILIVRRRRRLPQLPPTQQQSSIDSTVTPPEDPVAYERPPDDRY